MAVAPGVGVAWSILPSVRVYGEFYGAPSGLTSGNDSYKEADVGANWTVFAPLNVKPVTVRLKLNPTAVMKTVLRMALIWARV